MKILHYVDESRLAWAESWIQFLKGLESKGIDNRIVCRSGGTLSERLDEEGLYFETFDVPIPWFPRTGTKFGQIISDFCPDIIHTRLSSAARIGGFWGKKKGIPVIQTVDKYPKAYYHKDADFILTCSESVKRHMISLGYSEKNMLTVFNPVDHLLYLSDKEMAGKVREQLGIGQKDKIVLAAGRFVKWKGFDVLITAFKSYADKSKENVKLLLLGDGEERVELCKLIKTLGIEDTVIMPGFIQDIRPFMWASDIFVLPSKTPEPFGVVLIEAMASGLASIATRAGGPLDIIKDGVNGYLVDVNSSDEIENKMQLLLNNDDIRLKIAQAGMQLVSEKFAVREVVKKHLEVYNKVLETKIYEG